MNIYIHNSHEKNLKVSIKITMAYQFCPSLRNQKPSVTKYIFLYYNVPQYTTVCYNVLQYTLMYSNVL